MADDLDLEEELLQVAGRSRAVASKKRSRGRRANSDDDESSEDLLASDSDDGGRRKKSKKKSSSKKQRGGKGAASDDDDEEQPAEDGYGSDLYEDEADRQRLEAMTELEREMLLAERAEERDKARQRKEILKKARETDKAEPKGQRLSSRQKKAASEKESRKFEAARKRQGKDFKGSKQRSKHGSDDDSDADEDEDEDEYVDSEEEDGEEEEEEEARPARRPTTRAAAGSQQDVGRDTQQALRGDVDDDDDDAFRGVRRQAYDADDGLDGDGGRAGAAGDHEGGGPMDDDENADHSELRAIQLTRSQLEAMCDKPFFEGDGLNGALVRMAYGPPTYDKEGKAVTVYWMMQIVSIKETNSSYAFGDKQQPCFKKLELKDGVRNLRTLPMTTISNQPLTDGEIDRWGRHALRVRDKPISKQQASDIKTRIQQAINYRWDSQKVKEVLSRKRDAGMLPVNAAAEKSRLQRLLDGERLAAVPDVDKIAEFEVKVQMLEEQMKKAATEKRSGMASINQRNKEANFNNTIRNVSNKPANAPERKGGSGDPFSRRVTRPNIYWNTKKDGPDATATPPKAPAPTNAPKLKASMARMDPVDLVKKLDIDIDVAPIRDNSVTLPLHLRVLGRRWQQSLAHHFNANLTGMTVLSVQDWQIRAQQNES